MFKFNRSTVTEVLHVICIQNLNECLSSIDLVTEVLHVICIQNLNECLSSIDLQLQRYYM